MSAAHTSLDAAATDRKARLAKLASLKRKQPGSDITDATSDVTKDSDVHQGRNETPETTDAYISGRNYDIKSKAPKLGFENAPSAEENTVEQQAERLATTVTEQAAKDEIEADNGIDLFKLQPKKPNWDLKRDLAEKMQVLDARTQNAIARLVRERIDSQKKKALQNNEQGDGAAGEELGLDGSALVEGVHTREREEQQEEQRARELEAEEDV